MSYLKLNLLGFLLALFPLVFSLYLLNSFKHSGEKEKKKKKGYQHHSWLAHALVSNQRPILQGWQEVGDGLDGHE